MYKVVRKTRSKLYSAIISKHNYSCLCHNWRKWIVRYEPNKWIKAKIGKLFVFKNFEDALGFIMSTRFSPFIVELEIWQCKTIKAQQMNFVGLSIPEFLSFWNNYPRSRNSNAPRGTFAASKVMLTKRVRVWHSWKRPWEEIKQPPKK